MLNSLALLSTISVLLQIVSSEPAPAIGAELRQSSPFTPPYARNRPVLLFKRQSCPADHTSCSDLNAPDACCATGTNCARDQQGNIACCPINNVCTGVIGGSAPSSSNTAQTGSVTGGVVGTVTVTSTAGATGGSITTPASITGSVAGGGSTLPNAYYPFVYLPTSFGNAAICSQYYTSCQAASTSCFQSLAGINGVTVDGMGGGTTQAGSSGIIQLSASSICSSLSQSACRGLQNTQCAQFGSTGATASGFVQTGGGPRETGCPAVFLIAAAGIAAGAVGAVV